MPRGIYIVGALGEVAATLYAGTQVLAGKLQSPVGLLTESSFLSQISWTDFSRMRFAGADIRVGTLSQSIEDIVGRGGAISSSLYQKLSQRNYLENFLYLDKIDGNISSRQRLEVYRKHLIRFKDEIGGPCLLLFLPSVETSFVATDKTCLATMKGLRRALERGQEFPDSILWAWAAIETKFAYVNFTPNTGIDVPALRDFADAQIPYAGSDGKTGETLLKSVLGPLFKARQLKVLSWEGLNLLGNGDGLSLKDEKRRENKIRNKDQVLASILGKDFHGGSRIDYTPSLGDWKTAWDFIHFEGFMGVKMNLQFTWQGCDSALAAPLCLDLIRFLFHAQDQGGKGVQKHTACFFKNPLGGGSHDFFQQFNLLLEAFHDS
jgi:myo-inositol-1-phosphate synthase